MKSHNAEILAYLKQNDETYSAAAATPSGAILIAVGEGTGHFIARMVNDLIQNTIEFSLILFP